MAVTPTQFARVARQCQYTIAITQPGLIDIVAANWSDAKLRVLAAYREWIRAVRSPGFSS